MSSEKQNYNTAEAKNFLKEMHPDGPYHLCSIVPDGRITARTFDKYQEQEMHDFIEQRQGRENLYFHINALHEEVKNSKARKKDIAVAHFLHIDIDDLAGHERLKNFSKQPTAIIFSGGGYNAYWRIVTPSSDLELIERINKELVLQLDGDPAATDVSRILRLPGTINLPTKKKREAGREATMSRLIKEDTDWTVSYSVDDFDVSDEAFPGVRAGPSLMSTQDTNNIEPICFPSFVNEAMVSLILHGDDERQPRTKDNPRYKSRSEAVFAVATYLARNGSTAEEVAGVLINSEYKISESILEKNNPVKLALRQAQRALIVVGDDWPDGFKPKSRVPKRTFQNTQTALVRLGFKFSFDEFRQRWFVSGELLKSFQGEISDPACTQLRDMINKEFGFDPGKELTRDSVDRLCNANIVNPVADYLSSLTWDKQPRLDKWLVDFAGADDNDYVNAVARISLIAAVRRIRIPGVKFDTMPVLEGLQGSGKSTLLMILASQEFFSDNDLLALDTKSQMEAMEGIWIYEIPELAGMRYTDVNKIKAFTSRSTDRARPAYARYTESRPRRCILIGTTNDDQYLKDETGNRRFWPVRTGKIDLDGLKCIRDQLWAEAVVREAAGEEIILPKNLWSIAEIEQNKRVEADGWEDILSDIIGEVVNGREILGTQHILSAVIGLDNSQIQNYHYRRLAKAMRANGWDGPKAITTVDGRKMKGYTKPTERENDKFSREI